MLLRATARLQNHRHTRAGRKSWSASLSVRCSANMMLSPLGRTRHAYATFRAFCSGQADQLQVYILDPKILFSKDPAQQIASGWQHRDCANAAAPYVPVTVPRTFLSKLTEGHFQLGDMDNPGNSWIFGEEGELFEQKHLGSHTVDSGFTSIVTAEAFAEIQRGPKDVVQLKLPTWEQFTDIMSGDEVTWPNPQLQPLMLFAGRMVESDTASVYRNPSSGDNVTGIVITTSADEVD